MSEFSLIQRYFTRATPNAILGVGDDAALIRVADGMELAVSTDMLVSGTHFFPDADPYDLGHKTLAVNLSDMAAMGATPRWATLALSLPKEDEHWLEQFSAGFFALADQFNVELIGGDTTSGPLNLCVTIMGEVPRGKALRRDAVKLGDDIWVSGTLGNAALALAYLQGKIKLSESDFIDIKQSLNSPMPRVRLGEKLQGIAHSAIDISDGLLADLGHMLERSQLGAELNYAAIPCSKQLGVYRDQEIGQQCILAGGDDYELCFTAPSNQHQAIQNLSKQLALPLSCIGKIVAGSGCKVLDATGLAMTISKTGYDHFK